MSMIQALIKLRPEGRFSACDEDYDTIENYTPEVSLPTREEVEAEMLIIEQEQRDTFYRFERMQNYPEIGDQLDALFHAGVFPEEMAQKIQAVKDSFPKPSSEG